MGRKGLMVERCGSLLHKNSQHRWWHVPLCKLLFSCGTANEFQCCVTQHENKMNLKDTNTFLMFHLAYNPTAMSCGFKVQLSGCHLIYPTQNFLFSPVLNSEHQHIGISITCYTRVCFFITSAFVFLINNFWRTNAEYKVLGSVLDTGIFFSYSFRFIQDELIWRSDATCQLLLQFLIIVGFVCSVCRKTECAETWQNYS